MLFINLLNGYVQSGIAPTTHWSVSVAGWFAAAASAAYYMHGRASLKSKAIAPDADPVTVTGDKPVVNVQAPQTVPSNPAWTVEATAQRLTVPASTAVRQMTPEELARWEAARRSTETPRPVHRAAGTQPVAPYRRTLKP